MRHVKAWRLGYERVAVGIRTCGGRDTNVWRTGYERVADATRKRGERKMQIMGQIKKIIRMIYMIYLLVNK